ncbi:hypothetical protein KUV85_07720 [Nocardioides panacisoli]|uniref:hypothetical protein n=1 Tax=Nocardioides panacisoli TaxID=627624 RepID=UPI001C629E26|nr:hypothetical protein [Nocardioides panacisoli]QYJ05555.1 hypothetical protein KUV85_07720 [Nocardioides panacisoli]
MSGGRLPVGRRPVVVAAAALVAGCDVVEGSAPAPAPRREQAEPATGDEALIAAVTDALARTLALAERVASLPGLAGLAAPYVALHRGHGQLLGGLPDVDPSRVRRQRARQALRDGERDLQQRLAQAAGTAQSGALAQALAAMAAAVAQQRKADR